jgi:hypothetical protein
MEEAGTDDVCTKIVYRTDYFNNTKPLLSMVDYP